MVRHIILMTFKDDSTDEQIEAAFQGMRAIKEQVPQIRSFSIGKAHTRGGRPPRYNVAMVMDFDNFDDVDIYNKSQAHDDAVQKYLVPVVAHITGVDYDLEPYRA
ncbi:MAG: Dabb family protein [Dehalococcoidia bacterium]